MYGMHCHLLRVLKNRSLSPSIANWCIIGKAEASRESGQGCGGESGGRSGCEEGENASFFEKFALIFTVCSSTSIDRRKNRNQQQNFGSISCHCFQEQRRKVKISFCQRPIPNAILNLNTKY